MKEFRQQVQLRWADLDPNFHLRHSVYYDYAAQLRTQCVMQHGITSELMVQEHFGPVLFREEAVFKREIRYTDEIWINLKLSKVKKDHTRFSFVHEITKADGTLCAVITVDGAWMDTKERKLRKQAPQQVIDMTGDIPKTDNFEWMD